MYNTAKHCQYQQQKEQLNQSPGGTEEELQLTNEANDKFQRYLQGNITNDEWLSCRTEVNRLLMKNYSSREIHKWKLVIETNDASSLWKKINWKGELVDKSWNEKSPSPDALAKHFESKSSNVGW